MPKLLCIDIGGTRIKWAVLESPFQSRFIQSVKVESIRSLGWLNSSLPRIVDPKDWACIFKNGISSFDQVRLSICTKVSDSGEVVGHLHEQNGVPRDLAERFSRILDRPVQIHNDAKAWLQGALCLTSDSVGEISFPAIGFIFGTGVAMASISRKRVNSHELGEFKIPKLAQAIGWRSDCPGWRAHEILGHSFFEWVKKEQKGWTYHQIREEFTKRVIALIEDTEDQLFRPASLIIGGGNAEYVSIRKIEERFRIRTYAVRQPELAMNPDFIPLIGLTQLAC